VVTGDSPVAMRWFAQISPQIAGFYCKSATTTPNRVAGAVRTVRVARSAISEAPAFETLDEAVSLLRDGGRRVSLARRQLLEGLFAVDRPVTAEELSDGLGGRIPPSDLAVVYRNLETLEELGLVCHVHLGHAPGRYALVRGNPCEYLACKRCGVVTEIESERLDAVRELIEDEFGFHASFTHFPIAGLCNGCARITNAMRRAERS
jgi:Fur family ferric uptake transcriptional regulator